MPPVTNTGSTISIYDAARKAIDGIITEDEVVDLIEKADSDGRLTGPELQQINRVLSEFGNKFESPALKNRLKGFAGMTSDVIRNMVRSAESFRPEGKLTTQDAENISRKVFKDGRITQAERGNIVSAMLFAKATPEAKQKLQALANASGTVNPLLPTEIPALSNIPARTMTFGVAHSQFMGGTVTTETAGRAETNYYLKPMAVAGKPMSIAFSGDGIHSANSVPTGGTDQDGVPTYYNPLEVPFAKVELQYRFNNGPISTVEMPLTDPNYGNRKVNIDVPANAQGEMQYWFKMTGTNGQTYWDSQNAANYRAKVLSPEKSTVRLDGTAAPSASAPLKAGQLVDFAVDLNRLIKANPDAVNVLYDADVMVSFDGGRNYASHRLLTEAPDGQGDLKLGGKSYFLSRPAIAIPEGATSMKYFIMGSIPNGKTISDPATPAGVDNAWRNPPSNAYSLNVTP